MNAALQNAEKRIARLEEEVIDAERKLIEARSEMIWLAGRCSDVPSMVDVSRMRSMCESIEKLIQNVEIAKARAAAANRIVELFIDSE